MEFGGYRLDVLVQGYPGKTRRHGGLGWSTVALLRGHGRTAVVDTGGFGMRGYVLERLHALGVAASEVTDLLLTHLHYDHMINWLLFPDARMVVGAVELDWAMGLPFGDRLVPELYVRELAAHPGLCRVADGEAGAAGRGGLSGARPHAGAPDVPGGGRRAVRPAAGAGRRQVPGGADAAGRRHDLRPRGDPDQHRAHLGVLARKSGSLLLPGHDQPMVLRDGVPTRVGRPDAAIIAIMGEDLAERAEFDLAGPA